MNAIQHPEIRTEEKQTTMKLTKSDIGINPTPIVNEAEINAINNDGINTLLTNSNGENNPILIIRHIWKMTIASIAIKSTTKHQYGGNPIANKITAKTISIT